MPPMSLISSFTRTNLKAVFQSIKNNEFDLKAYFEPIIANRKCDLIAVCQSIKEFDFKAYFEPIKTKYYSFEAFVQ
jgi:hypothetical protein